MQLKLTVDRLEGDKVILTFLDKTNLVFPKDKLPTGIKVGQELYFIIKTSLEPIKNNKEIAKELLNEILKTD